MCISRYAPIGHERCDRRPSNGVILSLHPHRFSNHLHPLRPLLNRAVDALRTPRIPFDSTPASVRAVPMSNALCQRDSPQNDYPITFKPASTSNATANARTVASFCKAVFSCLLSVGFNAPLIWPRSMACSIIFLSSLEISDLVEQ